MNYNQKKNEKIIIILHKQKFPIFKIFQQGNSFKNVILLLEAFGSSTICRKINMPFSSVDSTILTRTTAKKKKKNDASIATNNQQGKNMVKIYYFFSSAKGEKD